MRSNYKRLGEHIREVNIRNKDLEVDRLLGVSIQKIFIPSIANTVGTNMKNYKIVKNDQFVYGTVTSRNGDKISIAHLIDYDEAIVSQAYKVFEIIDKDKLLPKYLMMWFSRPEFDRYARYMSHGSTREVFGWGEICDVELPIPDIDIQREMVRDYETITQRVENNKNIIKKLESTAGAIYREWFVDFEFPNDTGKPYKSSGGEMEYNKELDMEMPVEWGVSTIGNEFDIKIGRTPPRTEYKWFGNEGTGYKWVSIKDMTNNGVYLYNTNEYLTNEAVKKFNVPIIEKNITIMSFKMSVGYLSITTEKMLSNEAIAHFNLKGNFNLSSEFIYCFLKNFKFNKLGTTSSIVNSINSTMIKDIKIIIPNKNILIKFDNLIDKIFGMVKIYEKENIALEKMQSLLLSRMVEREEDLVV